MKLGANKKQPKVSVDPPSPPIANIDTSKIDYSRLDLNKLDDATLNAHKKAMDKDYNKNFVGAADPNFKYDVRKDFSKAKSTAAYLDDDSWDDDE